VDLRGPGSRPAAAPVRLRTASPRAVLDELHRRGRPVDVEELEGDALRLAGASAEEIGAAAFAAGSPVLELAPQHESLEQLYLRLTHDEAEYRTVDDREGAHR
jgi:ABC-2 type transport system ATP-binding protein